MALVTIIVVLALLMVLAMILTEKVWQSTRNTALSAKQERAFWAAQAGLEWSRLKLANDYSHSNQWQTYLGTPAAIGSYPSQPALQTTIDGLVVDLFVRDNPEADNNANLDSDLQLFVLARARFDNGPETLIEGRCGFDSNRMASSYKQLGQNARKNSQATDTNITDLTALPTSNYQLSN
jgi:hypothetical protein